jgi:two-component system, NarL family, sensor histidine kinase DevS
MPADGARSELLGTAPLDDEIAWAIVALAPNAILLVEPDGSIVLANHQADTMFGYSPGELLGAQVDELVPPQVRNQHRAHRRAYDAEPRTRPMGSGLDLHAARKDGSTFPVEIALSPLAQGDHTRVVAIVRDITERVQAERRIREIQRELSVGEDRERIARDLHDTVIQRLFAAGMSLQAVATQAEPRIGDRVGSVIDELDETIREIRQAIFQLTAHTLERGSLRRQIIEVVEQQEEALGFAPEVRFDGPVESVDDERATHLLAVLREALANVARHARASRVEVHVDVGEDLTLLVGDDGVGMPARPVTGGGTVNLRERAEALGGTVEVAANEPRGTCVRWSVPAR